jgi:hypothetical protein
MLSGQPYKDIALRLRNWLWYWLMKDLTGWSDDVLDMMFVKPYPKGSGRPRCFHRIRGLGSSPAEKRGSRKDRSIFEEVHQLPGLLSYEDIHSLKTELPYQDACHLFVSPLWEILSTPNMTLARVKEIIDMLTLHRQMIRMTGAEYWILDQSAADIMEELSALKYGYTDSELLSTFQQSDDVDSLALLIALYKEAVAEFELQRAIDIGKTLGQVLNNFKERYAPLPWLETLFVELLRDRAVRNIWITEADYVRSQGFDLRKATGSHSESKRRREIMQYVQWIINRYAGLPKISAECGIPLPLKNYKYYLNNRFRRTEERKKRTLLVEKRVPK